MRSAGAVRLASISCAIYTRKSSEEGLEQDFNSLDAQRESCAAFIQSQKALGWTASLAQYSDGGYSGGNTERPGLKQLLADIQAKRIKVIVVYKVDRLTRSLADFAKLVELFDAHGVSFVSVTQQFNTTSSMGRLTLNVLLSFAQFEREVTGERIRDKIAASKRKGMWMGGIPPMGYVPRERSLAIDEKQATKVREIFKLYLKLGCVRKLKTELDRKGWTTAERITKRPGQSGNKPFSRGHLYRILSNPVYIGQIRHKEEVFEGTHAALIDKELWAEVQELLISNRQGARGKTSAANPSLLAGLVFDEDGNRLVPTHAQKGSRRYRYYVSASLHEESREADADGFRIPAQELEDAVIQGIKDFLTDEARLMDWLESRKDKGGVGVREVMGRTREAVANIQTNPKQNLLAMVQRIMLQNDRMDIAIRCVALMGQGSEDDDPVWLSVPLVFRRRGRTMRLILNNQTQALHTEQRLLDLLVNAHDWFCRLTSGRSDGVGAIAREEGLSGSYVTRVMYLAFLAPDIVERIVRGDYPAELTAEKLMRMVPLTGDWGSQRRALSPKW